VALNLLGYVLLPLTEFMVSTEFTWVPDNAAQMCPAVAWSSQLHCMTLVIALVHEFELNDVGFVLFALTDMVHTLP
jgi:hypothetical protein